MKRITIGNSWKAATGPNKPWKGRAVQDMNSTFEGAERSLFARWARLAIRHRVWVLASWIVVLVVTIVLSRNFGGDYAASFAIPGTESQRAFDLLKSRFPQQAGDTAALVFEARDGVGTPPNRERVDDILLRARDLPGVVSVSSPYEAGSRAISADGRIAYATVAYSDRAMSIPRADTDALFALADRSDREGLNVEVGGRAAESAERQAPGASEAIGLIAAIVVLLIAFGSVVAMGLPLATALVGLGASFALIGLLANVLDLPRGATTLASMIGIGVGIDYSLFVVTRFREELKAGNKVEDSIVRAVSTAGRSVTFAGLIVAIALGALAAVGTSADSGIAIAMAVVVALAVLTALTMLPALLAVIGRRIDRWAIPVFHGVDTGDCKSLWYRLSAMIQRRPLPWFVISLAVLVILATPVLGIRLGSSDAGNSSPSQHSRRAYDLLAQVIRAVGN